MLAHKIEGAVLKEIMLSKNSILALGIRLFKEHSYQSSLVEEVQTVDREKTILGVPFDEVSLKGIISRFATFIELVSSDRDSSLASIFARVSPELADIYKFNEPIAAPATIPSLVAVRERIGKIDAGRGSGPTPRSAWMPLELFFGSTKNNLSVLLDIFTWAHDGYETSLDDTALESVRGIIGILKGLGYVPTRS